MIDDKYRARVLEAMEAEFGPAETPEQEKQLLDTMLAERVALDLAIGDFGRALREAFQSTGESIRSVAKVFRKM